MVIIIDYIEYQLTKLISDYSEKRAFLFEEFL